MNSQNMYLFFIGCKLCLSIRINSAPLRHRKGLRKQTNRSFILLQEYKVSTFEQRLMNEIEYRLEHTPPVNEDPQDAVFETVPESEQVSAYFVVIKLRGRTALPVEFHNFYTSPQHFS